MYAIRSYYGETPWVEAAFAPRGADLADLIAHDDGVKKEEMKLQIRNHKLQIRHWSMGFVLCFAVITSYSIHYTKLYDSGLV